MGAQPLLQGNHLPISLVSFLSGPLKASARFSTPHFSIFLHFQHQVVLQAASWALLPLSHIQHSTNRVILALILAVCRAN